MTPTSEELQRLLEGAIGFVEATIFERQALWLDNLTDREKLSGEKLSWKENTRGYLETIGWIDHRPIVVSMFSAVIDGHKVIFWHATSQIVDYALIEFWLRKIAPQSAKRADGSLNTADPTNFHNLFSRALIQKENGG